MLRPDVNNSLEGSAASNPVRREAQLVGLNQFPHQTATMSCLSIHLDCGIFECLRELRLTAASLDLSDGADHLTVGETVDRIESL